MGYVLYVPMKRFIYIYTHITTRHCEHNFRLTHEDLLLWEEGTLGVCLVEATTGISWVLGTALIGVTELSTFNERKKIKQNIHKHDFRVLTLVKI